MTTGESPAYPKTEEACYLIGGAHGSLSIPSLDVWKNGTKRSWREPFEKRRVAIQDEDPLALQIRQFCKVIRGEEPSLVSGREGLNTLKSFRPSSNRRKAANALSWDRNKPEGHLASCRTVSSRRSGRGRKRTCD
jgi:hypothetical protein